MRRLLLFGAMALCGGLALHDISTGHGGTYRGPGDTVPPGGGGGSGSPAPGTPGPTAPGTPGPGTPSTPGPGSAGSPGGAPSGGGAAGAPLSRAGAQAGPDLSIWDFWWGFNKEPYLNLRQKIRAGGAVTGGDDFWLGRGQQDQAKDTLRPSEAAIRNVVVPALLEALAKESAVDIVTGALIALAKIGDVATEDGKSPFVDVIAPFLLSGNQQVSETAAVALGILADERSLPLLVALMKDERAGRKAVGGKEVPFRTRAFATYGLGLIGHRTKLNEVRQDVAQHLVDILEAPEFAQRDIKVAALNALGLVPLDWSPSQDSVDPSSNRRHVVSRTALVQYIADYMDPAEERANSGTRHWFTRTHGPIALGRLLQGETLPAEAEASFRYSVEVLLRMADQHSREMRETQWSALIGMGMIANAGRSSDKGDWQGKLNDRMLARLLEVAKTSAHDQGEFFALIGLAQAGGRPGSGEQGTVLEATVEKKLLELQAGARGQKQPWSGLALGVFGRQLQDSGRAFASALPNQLVEQFRREKSPELIGAYALALGLIRWQDARGLLIQRFTQDFGGNDEARGYIAVGLGLMEAREAIEPIQRVLRESKYRPELLRQAAIALGLLGDKSVVPDLLGMLREARGLSSQSAIASALGTIGDARSIDPLVAFLGNDQYTDTARAFAAVALGIVCDKEDLPWNAKLAINVNYRANVLTLTSPEGTGILDIL